MKRKLNQNINLAFDVSALPDYSRQEMLPLVTELLFDGKTGSTFEAMPGVKYKDKINSFDDVVIFQDGAGCGNDPSGNTVFAQKEIQVYPIEVFKEWCPDVLRTKWTQMLLNPGLHQEELPEGATITDFLKGLMNQELELAWWKGDLASGNVNLNKFDGIIKKIDVGGAVDANVTGGGYTQTTSITTANIIGITDQMVTSLPAAMKGKGGLLLTMGWNDFEKLLVAYRTVDNNYVDMSASGPYTTGTWVLPTWGIKVEAFHGLTGTNRMFLMFPDNPVLGTDLTGEFENWDIFYDRKDNKIYGRVQFKAGVQIKKNFEVVQYTNK